MDKFLDHCYGHIITDILNVTCSFDRSNKSSESLHKLIKTVNSNRIECNYNEEGLLHSKYLDDRYEPAITIRFGFMVMYYYLFDGEIKDCVHPFSVKKYSRVETFYIVLYYSERIEQDLPIKICEYVECNIIANFLN